MNVEDIKKKYTPGMRIKLIRMDDRQAPPSGTCGTVMGVDDIGNVLMNWDNGSHLNLILGEDDFQILWKCPSCGREYTGHPAMSRKDNKTEICPDCGVLEALEAAGMK